MAKVSLIDDDYASGILSIDNFIKYCYYRKNTGENYAMGFALPR